MSYEPYFVRTAIPEDFESIRKLVNWPGVMYFGSPKRVRHFAKGDFLYFTQRYATHRIIAKEKADSDRLIGYAEFCLYPKIATVPQHCWMYWMKHHFCVDQPVTETNVMFFDHFIYLPSYNPSLVHTVLNELFQREMKIRFCAVIQMPTWTRHYQTEAQPDYYLLRPFEKIYYPICYSVQSCTNTQKIHLIERHDIVNKMRYRKAYPEDNDDIVEIVDYYRPDIRQKLGDFYIAEELLKDKAKTKGSKLICTDVDNETVGFIWLNRNVDILKCVELYEVDTLGNLVRFKATRPFVQKEIPVMSCYKRMHQQLFTHFEVREGILGKNCPTDSVKESHISRIYSDGGILGPGDEKLYYLKAFAKKVLKITNVLRAEHHYSVVEHKKIQFCYNILSTQSPEGEKNTAPEDNSNVFALQMLALSPLHDIRRAYRYICAAFSAFPNRDYCVFCMPSKERPSRFLTEVLQYFIRISPRPNCPIKDYFYLAHRSTLFGELCMYPVQSDDVWILEEFISQSDIGAHKLDEKPQPDCFRQKKRGDTRQTVLTETEFIYYALKRIIVEEDNSKYNFYTIRCGDSTKSRENNVIVGFVIVTKFTKTRLLSRHYVVPPGFNPRIDSTRGEIMVLRLLPFYRYLADFLFRELARRTDFYNLVYLQPTRCQGLKPYTNDLVKYMQPYEPKRIKKIYKWDSEMDQIANKLVEEHSPLNVVTDYFAFYEANLKPLKFFGSNLEIVILGFGPRAKAFVRALIFEWNQVRSSDPELYCCVPYFRKVMIIVPHGLAEADFESDFVCPKCTFQNYCWVNYWNQNAYVRDAIHRMEIRNYVGFITGTVTYIDRLQKTVMLENNCEYRYDYLFIMNDTQYGLPKPMTENDVPPNYLHINSRLDKLIAYHIIDQIDDTITGSEEIHIVVYGNDIATYEFIAFLISHGVRKEAITLVLPHCLKTTELMTKFNIANIDKKLGYIFEEMVIDLGIRLIEDAVFVEWECNRSDRSIRSVTFADVSGHKTVLPCALFFSFWWRYMVPDFLQVLKESLIDTEGECIVVDDDFRTNDPYIFASGNFITNRNEWTNYQYIYVSAKEAGEKLVKAFNKCSSADMPQEHTRPSKTDSKDSCSVRYSFEKSEVSMMGEEGAEKNVTKDYEIKHDDTRNDVENEGGEEETKEYSSIEDYSNEQSQKGADIQECLHVGNIESNDAVQNNYTTHIVCDDSEDELDDGTDSYHAKYSEAAYFQAQLPFGYKIVRLCQPKRFLLNHLSNEYERCMITNHDGTFCRMRVNQYGIIEDLTVVSHAEWDYCYDYLQYFCGKHEALLNNLRPRYLAKEIDSFPRFFEEPWSELVTHDHFFELQEHNKNSMKEVAEMLYETNADRKSRNGSLKTSADVYKVAVELEESMIRFLRKYRKSFDMDFALPEDYKKSSLF